MGIMRLTFSCQEDKGQAYFFIILLSGWITLVNPGSPIQPLWPAVQLQPTIKHLELGRYYLTPVFWMVFGWLLNCVPYAHMHTHEESSTQENRVLL